MINQDPGVHKPKMLNWYIKYIFKPRRWLSAIILPKETKRVIRSIIRHPQLLVIAEHAEGLIAATAGILLYDSVLKTKSNSPNIIEVGAYKGCSTCNLSIAAKKTGKRVKSFELFTGLPTSDHLLDPTFHTGQYASDMQEYEKNVAAYGCREVIDLIVGDARQTMLPNIHDGFCVAFLDVDVYEVTRELLFQLWSIAQGNEIIIVHDNYSPGVRKAIDEFHALSGNIVKETNLKNDVCCILTLPARCK